MSLCWNIQGCSCAVTTEQSKCYVFNMLPVWVIVLLFLFIIIGGNLIIKVIENKAKSGEKK